ncbi:MAG: PKD-like domain-containing protein [Rikenellaceae bacterium]
MRIKNFLLFILLCSSLFVACDDSDAEVVDNSGTPTVTFSEEDLIYEVKVNKTISIEPTLVNVTDSYYSWTYDGEVVSREATLDFSSAVTGQHFVTFVLDAANGSIKREIRIDVLEKTPPEVSLPLEDGMVRSIINRETEIVPTYQFCDDETTYQWYIDGEAVATTSTYTVNKDEINDFTIRLDVENEDGFTRVEATLRISEIPNLALDFDQDTYYVALGSSIVLSPYVSYADDATTYSWSVTGSSATSSTKYLTFTPDAVGKYLVTISGSSSENSAKTTTTVKCVEATDYQRPITAESSNLVTVYEFTAAPGQFINSGYTATTADEAATYAEGNFKAGSYVSLGAWGGYVVVGFDHSVLNVEDSRDFWVGGNAFSTSNEPAIVWVMQDVNGDGLPNDIWYEVKGSEYGLETTIQDYALTYYKAETGEDVRWTDNCGNAGTVDVNVYHSQNYFPAWITTDSYTITGTKIQSRTEDLSSDGSEYWSNSIFEWGYVDNYGSDYVSSGTEIEIDNAVNRDGTPANLKYIDFVKVQAAVNAKAGWLGENSPEVTGFKNLNL